MITLHQKPFVPDDRFESSRAQIDLHVGQPPATDADEVVVAARSPVVARSTVSVFDFPDGSMPAEPVQGVIDGCVCDPGMLLLNTGKDLRGGGMILTRSNHFQDSPPVAGEAGLCLHLELF